MLEQSQEPGKPYHQLHAFIGTDGMVRLGNCAHCVSTGQRPAVPRRGEFHPPLAVDYTPEQLVEKEHRLAQELAKHGVVVTSSTFVPKDTMDRADH